MGTRGLGARLAPGVRVGHVCGFFFAWEILDFPRLGFVAPCCGTVGSVGIVQAYRHWGKRHVLRAAKGNVVRCDLCGMQHSWFVHQRVLGGASRPIRLPAIAAHLDNCDMFSQAKIRNPSRKDWLARDRIVDSGPSTSGAHSQLVGVLLPAWLCVLWVQDGMAPCIMHRFVSIF